MKKKMDLRFVSTAKTQTTSHKTTTYIKEYFGGVKGSNRGFIRLPSTICLVCFIENAQSKIFTQLWVVLFVETDVFFGFIQLVEQGNEQVFDLFVQLACTIFYSLQVRYVRWGLPKRSSVFG